MEQPDYEQYITKEALASYEKISSRKEDVWNNITRSKRRSSVFSQIVRVSMRVAAVLVPFLVVTVIIASNFTDQNIFLVLKSKVATSSTAKVSSTPIEQTITFHEATLSEILSELSNCYPEIKGVKGEFGDDSVLVTTEFVNQSLDEVIEELNIHFGQKITLNEGYLVVSD